jgi:CRISPR-associated protein Cas4
MKEAFREFLRDLLDDLAGVTTDMVLLALLVVVTVIVVDAVSVAITKKRKRLGLTKKTSPVYFEGSERAPTKDYLSEKLGISGRPDAVIKEHGNLIPVEHKPLAKKVRDRYIAQLLVYMRLIEECEGQRPPYGYLLLGPTCRRVKIENTTERQRWLDGLLTGMQQVLTNQGTAKPHPSPPKCRRCDVRNYCKAASK